MAKYDKRRAWIEARQLISEHRGSLTIGLVLMVINRASGFVLPWTSKFLIDDIIGKHHVQLLMPLAAATAVATLIQAATSFALQADRARDVSDLRWRSVAASSELRHGMRAILDGDFVRAEHHANAAREMHGDAIRVAGWGAQMVAIREEQGRLAEVAPLLA